MSDIPKCEMYSEPTEIVCQRRQFCAGHIKQHVVSQHETHFLESQNILLQPEIQTLSNIKLLLNQELMKQIQSIQNKRKEKLRPFLKKIQEIDTKYKKAMQNTIYQKRLKLKEIEDMIAKKANGEKRLESLENRVEVKFQTQAKRLNLDSFIFPVQGNYIDQQSKNKQKENKIRPFLHDSLNSDSSQEKVTEELLEKGVYKEGANSKSQQNGESLQDYINGMVGMEYWKYGQVNGREKVIYQNGDMYDGEFQNGLFDGFGTFQKENGYKYIGSWKKGKRNGKGVQIMSNKSYYEGEFANGWRQGYGFQKIANGSEYKGFWSYDKENGHGIWKGSNGDSYKGQFNCGYRQGSGIYIWKNGWKYEGDWMKDRKHGKGVYTGINGYSYVGDFVNGMKQGFGTQNIGNGLRYVGEWKRGERHGIETYIDRRGREKKGYWIEGNRIN